MSPGGIYFTSESVSRGHPDKVCDQISDAVLDAYLSIDNESRVACETLATKNLVIIAGEVRGPESVLDNIDGTVRGCIKDIGYEQPGFHWETVTIQNHLHKQSADIAQGVDANSDGYEGAGDQGLMFGYAIDEPKQEYMPAPIYYSHRILETLDKARNLDSSLPLGPDAKSQLTIKYNDNSPLEITNIVLSTQHHDENLSSDDVEEIVKPIVSEELPRKWLENTNWMVNPTGKFVKGGPEADCGLTGRKIIVDTYGGWAPHGGGAFSGKDPTKVDRSAAYAARYLAKNVVAAGLANQCLIQIAYAIGRAEPTSFYINTYGTEKADMVKIQNRLRELMSLTPRNIREHLKLNAPIYRCTAAYGHFGRTSTNPDEFTWEHLDLIEHISDLG